MIKSRVLISDWIGTLSFTVSLVSAPLSVALIRWIGYGGYRKVALVGCLILSISCVASSMVIKIEWMFLSHSFLYGVGSSMLLMSSSLIIGEYFDKEHKRHVLATSILLCGYPVGELLTYYMGSIPGRGPYLVKGLLSW